VEETGKGKQSVLDGIAWALGGEKYRPSQPQREGALTQPYIIWFYQTVLWLNERDKIHP
jgi:hypothetical protein